MKLYYVHDPMCSWCWAFRPVWEQVLAGLPASVNKHYLLGGLAPDSDRPMPQATREFVQQNWRKIEQVVPNTRFNYAFWSECKPRRSTYPACRAVIAATNQDPEYEDRMVLAIQQAYYLQARNPSDDSTLVALAEELGLDVGRFEKELTGTAAQGELMEQIALGQRIGARGFPSLILHNGAGYQTVDYDYNDAEVVLRKIRAAVSRLG